MNLLIVDDEYLVVEEVVTVTDWGMLGITEIYSATNAVSAVRILNEKKIDIMICDIEMPQTDGLELSKKAKENFPDLEIVMLTSHAEFIYVRTALRYGCYDYLLKPVMEDDIIKVMKNLVTKIERERHQAQLQEEGIVWNQLKPVWKEKYWEEMLRGLRDDPNRECEEYEEKQWKEEQDRRLIPILFYQYANDKAEEDIKQTRKKVKEDLGTVAGDFLLPVLSQKEFAGLVFISDEWLSSGTERNGIILKDAILQQFKTERLYEKIGICIGEVCTGREVQSMVDKLRQFAWNNVCSRRQILDIINMPKNSEAIGMPDMTLWKAYIDNGKTVELQDIIRKWLWGKDNEAKLNRRALQMLQYDLEQLFYSTLQENGIQAHQFLYDRENGCNRVTAIGSLEEMDAYGIDADAGLTVEQLDDLFARIKEGEPDKYVTQPQSQGTSILESLFKTYDGLGDTMGVLMDWGQGDLTVQNLFDTEYYEECVRKAREWNEKGYILPDASTNPDTGVAYFKTGKVASTMSLIHPGVPTDSTNMTGIPCSTAIVNPAFGNTQTVGAVIQSIPVSCKNPEKVLEFVNLLYSDAEVYNALVWGIEGTHYQHVKGSEKWITYPDGVTGETSGYTLSATYAFGNRYLSYIWNTDPEDLNEKYEEFNDNAIKSKALGFVFDTTPVKAEAAAVQAVMDEYRLPLENGVIDPDENLPKFRQALKDAGIDTVIAEKQRQLDEWAATK